MATIPEGPSLGCEVSGRWYALKFIAQSDAIESIVIEVSHRCVPLPVGLSASDLIPID